MLGHPYVTLRASSEAVRAEDAADAAAEIVALAKDAGEIDEVVLVILVPCGEVRLLFLDALTAASLALDDASLSIVGVYSGAANADDVRDDLLAMPRGWECAP